MLKNKKIIIIIIIIILFKNISILPLELIISKNYFISKQRKISNISIRLKLNETNEIFHFF